MGQASSSFDIAIFQDNTTMASAANLQLQMVQQQQLQHHQQLYQENDLTLAMPEECLASVFLKLSTMDRNTCSLVCRRWHFIDAKSRSRLTLEARYDFIKDVKAIMVRFEHITSLSLKCHRRFPSIDDKTLESIGKLSRQLQRLKLKGCRALTDAGLEQFSKACGSLKKLSCSSCAFGAKGLNAVLLNCGELEDVSVKRFKRLLENPQPIVSGKGKLQRLSLKDLFNAQLFETLIAGVKHLRTLIVARNPGYWDHLFQIVTENLTELVELRCESLQMSDTALMAISRCKKLEVLYLVKASECTDHGVSALAAGCEKLKKLYLDDRKSNRVGDAGLLAVANRCVELKELVLIGVNATEHSLGRIASNCTTLERMALCNSETIGDAELNCIGEKCIALKKLCIKNCPISDYGLEIFAGGCPNLLKVKVKKCPNVTPFAAFWLQRNRASLKVSLDVPFIGAREDQAAHEHADRMIRSPTTMPCSSRSSFLKSKLTLAAGNLLRKFPKSSWSPSTG